MLHAPSYGYFENRFGEQFVFVLDRATKTGTVAGGDLGWGEPKAFTLGLLEEALRATRRIAEQIVRQEVPSPQACRSSTPRWRWVASPV
jgi:hypothetical protein